MNTKRHLRYYLSDSRFDLENKIQKDRCGMRKYINSIAKCFKQITVESFFFRVGSMFVGRQHFPGSWGGNFVGKRDNSK